MGAALDDLVVSVVVPVFNEAATIAEVVRRLKRLALRTDVIVVDDGSTDGTADLLRTLQDIRVITHATNRGKGSAIRSALPHCSGDVVIIQDADLELDVQEIPKVLEPIAKGEAVVAFGNRFSLGLPAAMPWPNRAINVLLRWLVRALYGVPLSDVATCYKAVPTELLRALDLRCERFEFCPEVTAKVIRYGFKIVEVPLFGYRPRTVRDGKKVRWTDGIDAIKTLFYWRFRALPPLPRDRVWVGTRGHAQSLGLPVQRTAGSAGQP